MRTPQRSSPERGSGRRTLGVRMASKMHCRRRRTHGREPPTVASGQADMDAATRPPWGGGDALPASPPLATVACDASEARCNGVFYAAVAAADDTGTGRRLRRRRARALPLPFRAALAALGLVGLASVLELALPADAFTVGERQYFVHCSLHGHLDPASHKCTCVSGWTGPDCSQRLCPTARAWVDYPSANDTAHSKFTECSGIGYCDRDTGSCSCRDGFEGPACERMVCPKNKVSGEACSGNGRCLTMEEAAREWNGRTLTRPNAQYSTRWDADMVRGCVCDAGYTGYDCSLKECPRGDDPHTTGQQNEKVKAACRADGGSVVFSFRGESSAPIPHDASYGTVERLIEEMDR